MTTFTLLSNPMAITGEAPLWDADRACLWWIDIQAQRLLCTTFEGQTHAIALPWQPGLLALGESGRLVIGLEDGLWAFDPEQNDWQHLSNTESNRPTLRLNDGKADPSGRLWFGSMDMTGTGQAIGRLYCRDVDGTVRVIREDVGVPNAIAPLADGSGLWFTDTPSNALELLSIDADAKVTKSETRFVFPEGTHPDGACLDAENHLWVAVIGPGEIWRLTNSGTLIEKHPLPVKRTTMPMLGGPNGHHLFVTNQRRFLTVPELASQPEAGGLHVAKVAATAGPVHRVAGV